MFKRILTISLVLTSAVGCKSKSLAESDSQAQLTTQVEPALQPFTYEFLETAKAHRLSPKVRDLEVLYVNEIVDYSSAYGLCRHGFVSSTGKTVLQRRIEIRRDTPADVLKLVLFHELNHCTMDERHFDEDADIMNSTLLNVTSVNITWPMLVKKMFTRISQSNPPS